MSEHNYTANNKQPRSEKIVLDTYIIQLSWSNTLLMVHAKKKSNVHYACSVCVYILHVHNVCISYTGENEIYLPKLVADSTDIFGMLDVL